MGQMVLRTLSPYSDLLLFVLERGWGDCPRLICEMGKFHRHLCPDEGRDHFIMELSLQQAKGNNMALSPSWLMTCQHSKGYVISLTSWLMQLHGISQSGSTPKTSWHHWALSGLLTFLHHRYSVTRPNIPHPLGFTFLIA